MTGVPNSKGCKICRRRKIKCDETWPDCKNCQKNKKVCPGRPTRFGPDVWKPPRLPYAPQSSDPKRYDDALQVTCFPVPPSKSRNIELYEDRCPDLIKLHVRVAENGSEFSKYRLWSRYTAPQRPSPRLSSASSSPPKSPLPRQPSPSQHHLLSKALIEAITTGSKGHCMSVFGPFIREVPARIGNNPALDSAVAVLVNAHSSLVHKRLSSEIVSPELYLRAIRTLKICLEDPIIGLSPNTLCASILLGLVEALAGPRTGNRYLAHAGGAGKLMELQGPERYRDPFAKELLRFNRGGIIVTSLYERKPCFLISPEWREIAFDTTGLSFDDCLNTDLMQYMAELPSIFHDVKDLSTRSAFQSPGPIEFGPDLNGPILDPLSDPCLTIEFTLDGFSNLEFSNEIQPEETQFPLRVVPCQHSITHTNLLYKVQHLKELLSTLGTHMNAKLINGTIVELPALENSPIPTAYHFNNWRDMTAYNCFWAVLILTNKILMRLLPPYDQTIYSLQSENRTIALEICKTWEDAWATKPIGAFHTGLSFVVAFEYCNMDVQEWIIRRLNSLLDYQMVDAFRWSEEVITMMSSKLAGEGPDMIFSNVKVSNKTG